MTTDPTLRCACCQAPMTPEEAAPAPEGVPARLLCHASIRVCADVALAHLAALSPSWRACLVDAIEATTEGR